MIERRSSLIDLNTKMNLRMVIELVAITIAATVCWMTLKGEVGSLRQEISALKNEVERLNNTRWTPQADYLYMNSFAAKNNLALPDHPGSK